MGKKVFLFLVAIMAITGCTAVNNKTNNGSGTVAVQQAQSKYPQWFLMPEIEGGVAASGSAKIGKAGIQFARTQALLQARAELARSVEIKVKDMTKNYMNVVGAVGDETIEAVSTQVSKSVASQTLKGSKQMNMFITQDNELLVLVAIPLADLSRNIKDDFEDEIRKERNLYQEFKADQGFKELDEEIEKTFENNNTEVSNSSN